MNTDLEYTGSHLYHRFLGRNPTETELDDLVKYGLGYGGYIWEDPRLRSQSSDVPILLLFSSCHCEQILQYLKLYRPDILESHSVNILFTHRLLLHRGHFNLDLIHAIFGHADKVLTNNMNLKFQELSTVALLPHCKPTCRIVTFVPPSFAALWPVVRYFGEEPVAKAKLEGKSLGDLIREFHEGTLDCMFGQRYAQQIERLVECEKNCDVGISDFMKRNLKTHRLFFTSNHMTGHVAAHITNKALGWMGFRMDAEDHALSLPTNFANFTNHWPEEKYAWDYFQFQYPMRYTEDWGGSSAFYPAVIQEIYNSMTDPAAVLANPNVPVELQS